LVLWLGVPPGAFGPCARPCPYAGFSQRCPARRAKGSAAARGWCTGARIVPGERAAFRRPAPWRAAGSRPGCAAGGSHQVGEHRDEHHGDRHCGGCGSACGGGSSSAPQNVAHAAHRVQQARLVAVLGLGAAGSPCRRPESWNVSRSRNPQRARRIGRAGSTWRGWPGTSEPQELGARKLKACDPGRAHASWAKTGRAAGPRRRARVLIRPPPLARAQPVRARAPSKPRAAPKA